MQVGCICVKHGLPNQAPLLCAFHAAVTLLPMALVLKRGAWFGNPCFTQIHPTCIPVSGDYQSKLTLMSESLRNDGRIWVPKMKGNNRKATEIPEDERDYYLSF